MNPDQNIPFELHITVEDLLPAERGGFVAFCSQREAKPILIELSQGECIKQPMLTKVVKAPALEAALEQADVLSQQLQLASFRVKRLKIEVPASCASEWDTTPGAFAPYFEWHGKIAYTGVDALKDLCLQHRVHLSLNALKNEGATRFITLREHGGKEVFEQRVKALVDALSDGDWPVMKQQSEYCVYDNNVFLDNGWLPQ